MALMVIVATRRCGIAETYVQSVLRAPWKTNQPGVGAALNTAGTGNGLWTKTTIFRPGTIAQIVSTRLRTGRTENKPAGVLGLPGKERVRASVWFSNNLFSA